MKGMLKNTLQKHFPPPFPSVFYWLSIPVNPPIRVQFWRILQHFIQSPSPYSPPTPSTLLRTGKGGETCPVGKKGIPRYWNTDLFKLRVNISLITTRKLCQEEKLIITNTCGYFIVYNFKTMANILSISSKNCCFLGKL